MELRYQFGGQIGLIYVIGVGKREKVLFYDEYSSILGFEAYRSSQESFGVRGNAFCEVCRAKVSYTFGGNERGYYYFAARGGAMELREETYYDRYVPCGILFENSYFEDRHAATNAWDPFGSESEDEKSFMRITGGAVSHTVRVMVEVESTSGVEHDGKWFRESDAYRLDGNVRRHC